MNTDEQIKVLRKWPRILALSFMGYHDKKSQVTWKEFCEAQDEYESVLLKLAKVKIEI